jgi:hypothetical protein
MSPEISSSEFKRILEIVKQASTVEEASAEILTQLKRPMSDRSLRRLFAKRGLATPVNYLRVSVDPIDAARKRDRESQLQKDYDSMVERVRAAEERQAVLDQLETTRIKNIKRRETKSGQREGTAVILASDWHIEEHVPSRADTNFNHYDLREAEKRCMRFFSGVHWLLDFHRPIFGLRDVVLWLGGDLMTGYLRAENLEENELSPVEALVWLQRNLVLGIRGMLDDSKIEQITIVCSHGNHGRTTEKPRRATGAKNSYEWLLYQWLKAHFENEPRVQFVTDQSNHQYLHVYDFELHFTHGDEVGYQGGIGGITIPLRKAVHRWNDVHRADFHHFGHFHNYLDLGDIAVNGSLIGYNAYGMSIGAPVEPPQQAFYVLDSKRGKTARCPIWVLE